MNTQLKNKAQGTLQITKILGIAKDADFKEGEYILREGEENQNFYLIMQGEVEISKKTSAGQNKVIAHLKSGEFFGEGALSGHILKPASARALTNLKLMAVSFNDFSKLIESDPHTGVEFIQSVLGSVSHRLNQTNVKLLALYEINKIMGIYRDDLNNLGKALIDKLITITDSREGIILLKNPFSENFRVIYSTTNEMNEESFNEKNNEELVSYVNEKHQYLLVSLKHAGLIVMRRDKSDSAYEDEHLRVLGLIADQAANTIESASRRASDKAKNILHQKKFVL